MGSIAGDELMLEVGGQEERILVSVRLRPLNTKEVARNDVSDWECINDKTLFYRNAPTERSMYPSAYTFDRVFGCDSPTKKVYEEAAKDVALSVVSGINASIFAYGQTSSGKTYTMSGITDFAVEDIYDYVQRHDERTFVLKFSAMEIYNESVRDLLSTDNTPLRLLDDPERGTVVDKLTEETLKDLNHLKELLSLCEAQRQIGETSLNEMSSRSHQILRLTIESCAREFIGIENSSTLAASVDFVDLAGSERASQTLSAGTRLKEGCHINRSLLTLGTVVRKLSKGRNGHVPYRDSKLTRILQCSLGGNAKTAIICTISPARSHVEQSRNTLTFASCAKEVATNAQVNVVMSDKALVKHLQRELARLEHELNGLGSSSPTRGSAALLKEKDLQIEKMENEIKELILQRNLAQARLGGLEQAGGSPSSYILAKFNQYSNMHASMISENEPTSPCVTESHCSDVGVKQSNRFQYSNGCHEISTNEHPKGNTEDPFLFDGPTPRFSTISPKFLGPDPYKGWDGNTQGCEDDFEELCKDVRCIEMEESSINRIRVSNNLTCEEGEGKLPLILSKVGTTTNQTCLPAPQKENEELNNVSAERMYGAIEQKYQNVPQTISTVDSSFSDEPSHCCVTQDLSSPRSLNQDSSSCSVNLMTDLSFPLNRKVDNDVNTPRSMSEQNVTGSPHDTGSNLSTLKCTSKSVCLSRETSLTSQRSDMTDELKAHKVKNHADDDATSINTFVSELKEVTKYQCENKHVEHQIQKNGPKIGGSERIVKDVGLDPMHDFPESPSNWLLEFESKRREIIELWQTCHVSLVHRTYFFLLFTGDPSDSIYMEVECRRLFFLKDLHSRGKYDKLPTEATRDLTPASSMKALRREREMLSKQMQKKLSDKERTKLFEKWGIGLNTKRRRLQLAQRLWMDTKDVNHITESANLVAKLVGLQEPTQGMKEMFILSFTPQKASRRSFSWRSTT